MGITIAAPLLPVKVKTENGPMLSSGTMEIKLSRGTLRIAGSVYAPALRAVPGVFSQMIGLPGGTRIWIAAGVIDLRKGHGTLLGDQGDHVQILSGRKQHSFSDPARTIQEGVQEFAYIAMGANRWIGTNSVVTANVGRDCVIGAGSLVTRAIPDNSLAVGNPARVTREVYRSQKDSSPSPPALKSHSGTIPDRSSAASTTPSATEN